jgi:hypothetical protein
MPRRKGYYKSHGYGAQSPRHTTVRHHFANSNQFADWFRDQLENGPKEKTRNIYSGGWGYSESRNNHPRADKGAELLTIGDPSIVEKAKQLVATFSLDIPSTRRIWSQDVAGFFPNVPAYLSNEPECMWRMEDDKVNNTPLRIYVGLTSTWNVTEEQIFTRGCALVAFALALSERRPVLITPYVDLYSRNGEATFISWDLATSPLIYSELTALGNPDITRYVGIFACDLANPRHSDSYYQIPGGEAEIREILGANEDDIVLGTCDSYDPLLVDPIKWVNENLACYLDPDNDEGDD